MIQIQDSQDNYMMIENSWLHLQAGNYGTDRRAVDHYLISISFIQLLLQSMALGDRG